MEIPNNKNMEKIQWNYNPELGEFLSRKGVEDILEQVRGFLEDSSVWDDEYIYLRKATMLHKFDDFIKTN